jgi:hypothetical protein
MKVQNISGYLFVFEKLDRKYVIPYDGLAYEIPDECIKDDFSGIFRIVEMPVSRIIPSIVEIRLFDPVDDVKPKVEKKPKKKPKPRPTVKPLKGIKIKKNIREQILSEKEI